MKKQKHRYGKPLWGSKDRIVLNTWSSVDDDDGILCGQLNEGVTCHLALEEKNAALWRTYACCSGVAPLHRTHDGIGMLRDRRKVR